MHSVLWAMFYHCCIETIDSTYFRHNPCYININVGFIIISPFNGPKYDDKYADKYDGQHLGTNPRFIIFVTYTICITWLVRFKLKYTQYTGWQAWHGSNNNLEMLTGIKLLLRDIDFKRTNIWARNNSITKEQPFRSEGHTFWLEIGPSTSRGTISWWAPCSPYKRRRVCRSVYGYLHLKYPLVLFGSKGSALTLPFSFFHLE